MASNTAPNPKCEECSELYTDPRMLPCLHSFCRKCIEKLVESQETKQALNCPTCKEVTAIPPGGVGELPHDIWAGNEAEVKRLELKIASASNEKCSRCVRTGNGPAVTFCVNCCKFLCKICTEDHTQWLETLNHELVEMGEEKKGKEDGGPHISPPPRPIFCGHHPDKKLKFYCESCQALICQHCILLGHNGHTYDRLEKVAEKERGDLLSGLDEVDEAKRKLVDAMAQRDKIMQQVELRKKAVDETIASAFTQLEQAFHRRKEGLLAKTVEVGLGKTSTLAIENEELAQMLDELDSTHQLIARATESYSPRELLSTKKLMKEKLSAQMKRFHETSLEPTVIAVIPTTLDVSPLLADIASFGTVTGGSCPWMASADIYIPRAVVNKERKIKVTARDEVGKPYPHGGEIVKVSCSLLGSNDPPTDGTTTDNGDGTYIVIFKPTTTGEHELKLSISGQPIKGSSFVISVHQERAYRSFSGYQQCFNTAAQPWDIAIHNNGDLYVAAYGAHCIYVLTSTGTHKLSFRTQGSGQGQFYYPSGIAVRGDVVFVAEHGNNRVQKLTIEGEHLAFIGEGQLSSPRGICLDPSGRIFVADCSNNRVQVFNEDGSHAYSITGSSTEGSNLSNPWGIAFDAEGQLHVVNYGSKLVRIFTADGNYVTTYGSGQLRYGSAGIAIDEEGYSFITEYYQYNSRSCYYGYLKIFNPQHQCIHSTTCTNGYFNYPAGVVLDKEGCVWVADQSNNCIKKF